MRTSQPKQLSVVRTGTDNIEMQNVSPNGEELPAVIRRGRERQVSAMTASGIDHLDIPAFLRKQAD